MEETILISYLNDFIYCPISIYFHKLYGNREKILYQQEAQIKGTEAHKTIDNSTYSTRKEILQGIEVYSEKYNIIGKIDVIDLKKKLLTERKNKITTIYDGYVFQLYAQYFALIEMGYEVEKLQFYSMQDNKVYPIKLPNDNLEMYNKFLKLLEEINNFNIHSFLQNNKEKCKKCIYEPACDRSLIC